jgi:hypothetical protein
MEFDPCNHITYIDPSICDIDQLIDSIDVLSPVLAMCRLTPLRVAKGSSIKNGRHDGEKWGRGREDVTATNERFQLIRSSQ